MDVAKWMRSQFTEARMLRWMDGCNPKHRYGGRSFVQALDDIYVFDEKVKRSRREVAPNIWSVVNVGKHDRRSRYYLRVIFRHVPGSRSEVVADVRMWSPGIWGTTPRRSITSEITFFGRENAPKKLNREVRRLRDELFAARPLEPVQH